MYYNNNNNNTKAVIIYKICLKYIDSCGVKVLPLVFVAFRLIRVVMTNISNIIKNLKHSKGL